MFHFTNDCTANIFTNTGIEPLNKDAVDRVMREVNITQPLWDEIANKLGFKPLLKGQNSPHSFVQGWRTFARRSQPSWKQLGIALSLVEDYKSKAKQMEQYTGKYNMLQINTLDNIYVAVPGRN